MCGIAGWVDFQTDLRTRRTTAETMTRTMAERGPDAEGLYLREHAALGHRRLSVIDLETGDQPMALDTRTGEFLRWQDTDRTDELAIVYSGETYNFREIRDELGAAGVRFATHSDTEVVLAAHREWGPRAVERFNGMFAYAIWDEAAQELLLVRDRLGIKPLYYYPTLNGVLFGSEPKAILANPLAERVVDEDGLRKVFGFVAVPGETPFRGMKEVAPGHVVRVSRAGIRDETYWTLPGYEHTDDLDTTIATVRDLLLDTADRQLIADVPLCTLLSGGLDSSALTALAAEKLRENGQGAVRSFSVDFSGYTDNFTADELRGTPDQPFVIDVAEHVAADHRTIELDNAALLDPAARRAVLHARDLPSLGEMDTSLYLLFKAVREQSTVALSGESADEVFGGYREFHDHDAIYSGSFPWLHGSMSRRMISSQLIADPIAKAMDMPQYLADEYATALASVPRVEGQSGHEARMREVCYLYLTRFLPNLLDRKDRMSMAVGLEVRVPFCDHRLVEYVFNTPWAMKTFDGREKSLLRAATARLLPESVVQRVKSPYPQTQDPGYVAATSAELARRVDDDESAVHRLADLDQVRELAASPDTSKQMPVDRLLFIDDWLRDYDVTLDV